MINMNTTIGNRLFTKYVRTFFSMKDISETRYGISKSLVGSTAEWVENEISANSEFISKSFLCVLREFDIEICCEFI